MFLTSMYELFVGHVFDYEVKIGVPKGCQVMRCAASCLKALYRKYVVRVRFLLDPFEHCWDTHDLVMLVSIMARNLYQPAGPILPPKTSDRIELTTSKNKKWSSPLLIFNVVVFFIPFIYLFYFPRFLNSPMPHQTFYSMSTILPIKLNSICCRVCTDLRLIPRAWWREGSWDQKTYHDITKHISVMVQQSVHWGPRGWGGTSKNRGNNLRWQ